MSKEQFYNLHYGDIVRYDGRILYVIKIEDVYLFCRNETFLYFARILGYSMVHYLNQKPKYLK